MPDKDEKKKPGNENDSLKKPDPETIGKTDPQNNMKGPVSSFMQNLGDEAKENDKQSKEEADREKDKNT